LAETIANRLTLPKNAKHDLFSFVTNDEKINQAKKESI
jgi:hypothetical protein